MHFVNTLRLIRVILAAGSSTSGLGATVNGVQRTPSAGPPPGAAV